MGTNQLTGDLFTAYLQSVHKVCIDGTVWCVLNHLFPAGLNVALVNRFEFHTHYVEDFQHTLSGYFGSDHKAYFVAEGVRHSGNSQVAVKAADFGKQGFAAGALTRRGCAVRIDYDFLAAGGDSTICRFHRKGINPRTTDSRRAGF